MLLILGEKALVFIGSKTSLMPQWFLVSAIFISFLENNHSIAGSILLSKNEVPFFKAAIISGVATILLLLLIFLKTSSIGTWALILAPGLVQGTYQNWKWPITVFKELKITLWDISSIAEKAIHLIINMVLGKKTKINERNFIL